MNDYISPIYSQFFSSELQKLKLIETAADCTNCSMAPGNCRKKITYQAHLKCCTYEPFLPNFLVGAILHEEKYFPLGAKTIREKISQRKYALPIGMLAPVRFQVEFNNRKAGDFGNREDWLCPYYDRSQQNCSIWKYRGHICTTFYCRSSYGSVGLKFWEDFGNYLAYVEMALMEEALVHLDFSPRQISDNLSYLNRQAGTDAELKSWILPANKARKLWNFYFDEQEDFYIKTYRFVKKMDPRYFKEAMGDLGAQLEASLLGKARKLTEK